MQRLTNTYSHIKKRSKPICLKHYSLNTKADKNCTDTRRRQRTVDADIHDKSEFARLIGLSCVHLLMLKKKELDKWNSSSAALGTTNTDWE